jgi:hypothetical protein
MFVFVPLVEVGAMNASALKPLLLSALVLFAGAAAAERPKLFDLPSEATLPFAVAHDQKPASLAGTPADLLALVLRPVAAFSRKNGKAVGALSDFAARSANRGSLAEPGSEFGLVKRATVNGSVVVFAFLSETHGEGMGQTVSSGYYALGLDASGAVSSAAVAAAWSSNMAFSDAIDGVLAADGTLTTRQLLSGGDGDREGETRVVKFARGAVQDVSSSQGPDGLFRDEKSRELLAITSLQGSFVGGVTYRAKAGKEVQTLQVVSRDPKAQTVTVRFAKSPKPYVITYAPGRQAVTCKNPDGSVQTFKRVGLSFEEPRP